MGTGMGNTPYRSYSAPAPVQPMPQAPYMNSQPQGHPFLRSMGAGIAGGMIGNMLARTFGGGGGGYNNGYNGYAGSAGGVGGGGIGFFEILLFGGLIFFLVRFLMGRKASAFESADKYAKSAQNSSSGWNMNQNSTSDARYSGTNAGSDAAAGQAINPEQATDLFFQVQGAWGNRDLSSVRNIVDSDARSFLDEEISNLKAKHQINRLENIAVRGAEVVEAWRESDKDFSTVRFTANLLDFTVDENTQAVVDGSKTSPVKFEEFWTFSKQGNSGDWKLSAIQQN
jgi:predicted lipid-binding transport protein (Tim44 family)